MNYSLQLRGAGLLGALIFACSAGGGGSKVDEGNQGGSGGGGNAGGSINPNTGGSGNAGGTINPAGGTGGGGEVDACQQYTVVFERRIPSVFVLVDRSGTMFE